MSPSHVRLSFCAVLLVAVSGCKVGGCAANVLGDVVGETDDVSCDRRYGKDRREKHAARTTESKCPREHIIAGCKIHKDNDDGSEVWDWYYDVSDLEDAGSKDAASDGPIFADPITTKEQVKALCADPTRYEEGATYDESP